MDGEKTWRVAPRKNGEKHADTDATRDDGLLSLDNALGCQRLDLRYAFQIELRTDDGPSSLSSILSLRRRPRSTSYLPLKPFSLGRDGSGVLPLPGANAACRASSSMSSSSAFWL